MIINNIRNAIPSIDAKYSVLGMLSQELQGLPWMIIGSMSLQLHDVDVTPNDIDILTTKEGAYRIEEILARNHRLVRPVAYGETEIFKSHYGELEILKTKVEIMGDLYFREKETENWTGIASRLQEPVFVYIYGARIPISPLDRQEEAYAKVRREKDLHKITAIRQLKQQGNYRLRITDITTEINSL